VTAAPPISDDSGIRVFATIALVAYEFSPDHGVDSPVADGEGGRVIEFAIGFDASADLIILMAVLLTATDRDDALELHFGIRARRNDGPATEPDYSKECVEQYIPRFGRDLIRRLIIESVEKLVVVARPEFIVMETYYANLEPKALAKYAPVCGAVTASGYLICWRDENDGKNYWIFKKVG
jgi:hypothetical protein